MDQFRHRLHIGASVRALEQKTRRRDFRQTLTFVPPSTLWRRVGFRSAAIGFGGADLVLGLNHVPNFHGTGDESEHVWSVAKVPGCYDRDIDQEKFFVRVAAMLRLDENHSSAVAGSASSASLEVEPKAGVNRHRRFARSQRIERESKWLRRARLSGRSQRVAAQNQLPVPPDVCRRTHWRSYAPCCDVVPKRTIFTGAPWTRQRVATLIERSLPFPDSPRHVGRLLGEMNGA